MATELDTCRQILSERFPSLDDDLFQYVTDILESGSDDFESGEDIFDAVGSILAEVASDEGDDNIIDICNQLLAALKCDGYNGGTEVPEKHKLLLAPVRMKELAETFDSSEAQTSSIWINKRENNTIVDQKKLQKAEAKLKAKQGKRTQDTEPINEIRGRHIDNASASQSSSKRESKLESSGSNKSRDVRIENFDLSFADRILLKDANLSLVFGRRYGLVGRNGIGKTTLIKMLSRRELFVPSHISILCVAQEVHGDETQVLQSVLECDTEREQLLKEERRLLSLTHGSSQNNDAGSDSASARLAEVYARMHEIEADKAPARASLILAGLGFSTKMQSQQTRELSGGWRMRLALARTLFSRPDLLLLDEPTNMLDLKAVLWLEKYLLNWPGTLLVVSHDRSFLDAVATDIIHVHSQRLEAYRGNHENFMKTMTEKLTNQQREYEAQQMHRQHLQAFVDRWRYNAKRASLAQSRLKALEKLPELQPVVVDPPVVLQFPDCDKLSPPILQLDEVTFYYEKGKVVLNKVSLSANQESRIALVGENGQGKTTLLKLLLGELEPVSGLKLGHRNLKIGYFSQHHVDQLGSEQSPLEVIASKFPGHHEEEYRCQLGRYGVVGDLALRPVRSLSGGQKSRVVMALMSMVRPHFLILDEPTNHLDVETIEALGTALNNYKGGVVMVTHDERLVRAVCKEVWMCSNGSVIRQDGGFDQYRKLLEDQLRDL
ncbi:ATP-binding cassette sub-family F member 3 [Acropora cervicornis]|uniref:ATP-binding cassette sub-family F member 3 n=1 Tax=Acropora cervicornis TaxID=6130 RepID=A0AAD9QAB7_ACRCE|nr:ATP-binding cassette sub-family F member 3 [Acropora cervicornis]